MADMFTPVVAPDVNTSRTTATVAPKSYTDYLSKLAETGTTAMNKPADQLVSPLTSMQNQGYAAVPGAADAYKPGLASAQQTATGVAQGLTPDRIQNLMNPYTTGVVDEMARLQQKNVQQNLMPQLKASFVGSGGLGGQRYANATGQTMADLQANLTGQQTGALQSGYNSALQAAIQEMQQQNQAALTQGNLAGKEQELGLIGAGALTKAGAEQQAFNQSVIDAPLKNATNASALMRGYTVPTTVSENYKGPLSGAYGNSPAATVASLGALLGSAFNTTTDSKGNVINTGYGNDFIKWLTDKLKPSATPDYSGGTNAPTPTEPFEPDFPVEPTPPSDNSGAFTDQPVEP